jgi:hypothetical protein
VRNLNKKYGDVVVKITTKYCDKEVYYSLKDLADYIRMEKGSSNVEWYIPLRNFERFISLMSMKDIEFRKEDLELISKYCPQYKKNVEMIVNEKGKGEITIERNETGYTIYEAKENGIATYSIDKITVDILRSIVNQIPIGGKMPSREVAEKMCRDLGIRYFFSPTDGHFTWEKFFGSRKDYYHYFYLPIKVLVYEGILIHRKSGGIVRIR